MEAYFNSRPDLRIFGAGAKDKVRVAQIVAALERLGCDTSELFSFDEHEQVYDLNVTDEIVVAEEVFNGLDDEALLRLLAIPAPIELKQFSEKKVMKLITEVLGITLSIDDDDLHPGIDGSVMLLHQIYNPSEKLCVHSPSKLTVLFHGIDLCAMSVSDFGNFLYAVKNHGDEVALATLHHIYSKTA